MNTDNANLLAVPFAGGVLRPLVVTDSAALAELANDRDIWLNLRDAFPHPYRRDDADAFIAFVQDLPSEAALAIEVAGAFAGVIGATRGSDVQACGAEVGYWLGRSFWGRGIATDALSAFRDWLFSDTDLLRLFALPFTDNTASCRVLEKSGFQKEGRLQCSAHKAGAVKDQFVYAAIRAAL
ncbi:MAG: GNAT family N-acetyltransferase [Pseudomonadota bacterium]